MVDPDACARNVRRALELGYRHVDTARAYGNEVAVGAGIAAADVPRDEVFVATKINYPDLGYRDVLECAAESRERLGLETIDLLYVHWPIGAYDPEGTLDAFDRLVSDGTVGHVGVSNFTPDLLVEALDRLDAPVLAHQVEMHPLYRQSELHELAVEDDHWLVAYSPLAQGELLDDPTLREVAAKHGASTAQVALAWLLAKENVAVIPKATGEHLLENHEARDVELGEEDVARIDAIDREVRTTDHDWAPWNGASEPPR
jgi:2,5-diketo-D-gluconate reductase B